MSKLAKWLRVEQPVRKGAGEVEAAYLAWAAMIAEEYGLADEFGTPTRYSLCRVAESSKGTLWSACDDYYYFGCVYVLDGDDGAEVMLAKHENGDKVELVVADETLLERIDPDTAKGEDLAETLVKAIDGEPVQKDAYRMIVKSDTQQYTLGVAYPHDEVDAHGDFTDETELEAAAWNFMRNVIRKGATGTGTDHADGTDDAGDVVESYIWRGPDVEFGDGDDAVVVKTGDWMVGVIWGDEAWQRIERGELTGYSIQGLAMLDSDATLEDDGSSDG